MPGKRMNIESMATLIKKAKEDPNFFHRLVFETEDTLASLDFLSRREKSALMRIEPEDLIVGLATGDFGAIGVVEECGSSCGSSCGGSCGGSCGISCGVSCGTSCAVSELMPANPGEVVRPATETIERDKLIRDIESEVARANFSRFRR
jgi:hypothetical protein